MKTIILLLLIIPGKKFQHFTDYDDDDHTKADKNSSPAVRVRETSPPNGTAENVHNHEIISNASHEEGHNYASPERDPSAFGVREERQLSAAAYEKNKIIQIMMNTPQLKLAASTKSDLLEFTRDKYPLPEGFSSPLAEYDYIIVGAGSAGSVLAARLSEDHNATVLLLEAGKPESSFTDVPILAPFFQQTHYTWPYVMEKQEGICLGMEDQRCFWPRGRAVGGSSVINYMIYTRGRPEDWDRIAADGNYGWSYADVLPYYLKSEKASLRNRGNSPWHNRDGKLSVEDVPFRSKLSKAFMDAGRYLGNRIVDYNAPEGFGFGYIQSTMKGGRRHSAAKAFLHPKKKRKNLHILPDSTVTKILIDPATKIAYGVEFHRYGYKYTIRAMKEVIISAGPIGSPHLLMVSGIGPVAHLQQFNIPVIQDSRVGETLYDHISLPTLTFTLNTTAITLMNRNIATLDNVNQWMQFGEGPLSSLAGVENIGYIKTEVSKDPGDYPDIELISTCSSFASEKGLLVRKGLHITDQFYNQYYRPIEGIESFSVLFMLLHPKSKGYLKLRDANPLHDPLLYGNYLTHISDIDTMIAAIRYIIKLVETPPYQKYGAKLYNNPIPNCESHIFNSDEYWECALRTFATTLHHQIATCRMGPSTDPDAIVDPELRVYGIKGLRVVDSSVIPRTISAHTNAPAIMIGEKAADLIKRTSYT